MSAALHQIAIILNRELSAKLIFLSTALSIVTIPLWAAVWLK